MTQAIQTMQVQDQPLSVEQVVQNIKRIDEIMEKVMTVKVHYDKPYTESKKMTLLKPGAEKLALTFGFNLVPEVQDLSTPTEVRYRVITTVYSKATGQQLGTGVGECSSMEEKYLWRSAVCEEEYVATNENDRRQKWKSDGTFIRQIKRAPAEVANTVLKMADKRSYLSAILKVTAASDMFEVDVEDLDDDMLGKNADDGKKSPEVRQDFFIVTKVDTKSGTKDGKSWEKVIIYAKDGKGELRAYNTFDMKLKDAAEKIIASGGQAHLTSKETKWGHDLLTLSDANAKKSSLADKARPGTDENRGHGEDGLDKVAKPDDQGPVRGDLRALLAGYKKLAVEPDQLEAYLGTKMSDWSAEQIADLVTIGKKLKAEPNPADAAKETFPKSGELFPKEKEPVSQTAFD
jgi:hypothetical protein